MSEEKKQRGDENKRARENTAAALASMQGKKIKNLTKAETTTLLLALCQWLGWADSNGKIRGEL